MWFILETQILIWETRFLSETQIMWKQALSETATGCYRLIMARLAPTVQRWLRTLSRVTAAQHGVHDCSVSSARHGASLPPCSIKANAARRNVSARTGGGLHAWAALHILV